MNGIEKGESRARRRSRSRRAGKLTSPALPALSCEILRVGTEDLEEMEGTIKKAIKG